MMSNTFHLGGPRARSGREDVLRGGEIVFTSPRGLRRAQALLVEALPKKAPGRALFGMDTEGAVALAARAIWPETPIEWFHLDAYIARKVERVVRDNEASGIVVTAREDPPPGPFDLIALPFPAFSEALLMRDLLEGAHDALRVGGRLIAATDKGGRALSDAVKKVFGKAIPATPTERGGACFYAERKKERSVHSDHSHVLQPTFRHADGEGETRVVVETRPGTFAHGAIDRGTRALVESLDPSGVDAALDLGGGSGVIGIYIAMRAPEAYVAVVESNARAAGCAVRNAERNAVSPRVDVLVRADLEDLPPSPRGGGYDLCVSNPPYFSDFRIARSFVESARRVLRPGGRLVLVVKLGRAAEGHAEILREVFRRVDVVERTGYGILRAART